MLIALNVGSDGKIKNFDDMGTLSAMIFFPITVTMLETIFQTLTGLYKYFISFASLAVVNALTCQILFKE